MMSATIAEYFRALRSVTTLVVVLSAFCVVLNSCGAGNRPRSSRVSNSNSVSTEPRSEVPAVEVTVNINTASSDELQRLPHVGPAMAQKIIEQRQEHGPFKRPEELMLIDGISDTRFRRIRHLIRIE